MKALTDIKAVPLQGGCTTAVEKGLLRFGQFSQMLNMRNEHPGLSQRPGQSRLHETPAGANAISLYQFRKIRQAAEKHFYAQMDDGRVVEADYAPPAASPGGFGSTVFTGSGGQVPASWGVINDMLIHSNGVDPHQIYPGLLSYVDAFWVYKGGALPDVPQVGNDYSDEVSDEDPANYAVLDSLGTYAGFHCVFVRTQVPCASISLTMVTGKENAISSAMTVYYRKSDNTWAAVSGLSDGTSVAGKTLAQSGTITWTPPADEIEKYAFGAVGFWYLLGFSAALDGEVRVSEARYTAAFQPIRNLWNGVPQYAVEVQVEGASQWEVYASGAVDIDSLASGKKIMVAFTDPVEGIHIDPGATPNAAGTTLTSLKYWDGVAFQSVGAVTDGTAGMSNAGWITFPRKSAQPTQWKAGQFQAYWYELAWSATISPDTVVAIQGMPYFTIDELGSGFANCVWKSRAVYSFDRYGSYIYITAAGSPMVLNGNDYGILQAGDGRSNRIVSMKKFYNELMVWQEERGEDGGCITLFEGYSPSTFGKILLSSRIGAMNSKCTEVVDGVLTATATDETIKTLAFSLSRHGACAIDGRTVSIISDDIANYFDPSRPECIRRGYENEHWLKHDAAYNVLRLGLVSGPTATKPNVFPVFDLVTKTWSFDTPGQSLSCMANIEAGSDTAPLLQVGAGATDGYVYRLNVGTNDVDKAVQALLGVMLSHKGLVLNLQRMLIRNVAQDNGAMTIEIYENDIRAAAKLLPMEAELAGQKYRRSLFSLNVTGPSIEVVISNASVDESMFLLDAGFKTAVMEER